MNVRVFIGIDPGARGACGVIAVNDCPADEAQHGRVVAARAFDLPTIERDGGGTDLDVVAFKAALRTAVVELVGDRGVSPWCDCLVEYPVINARFGGGVRQKVQQGVNAGAAWAATKAAGLAQVGWVDSTRWRGELASGAAGAPAKGDEISWAWSLLMGVPKPDDLISSTDRAVAILLAEVGRRRWLGTASTPKTTGTARAAKARKADRRKEAIARAVAPLTVAKARVLAVRETMCSVHTQKTTVASFDAAANVGCSPRNKCCEVRLLDWAWRQKPDLPDAPALGTSLRQTIMCMSETTSYERKPVTAREWSERRGTDEVHKLPNATMDILIDRGLVQMDPGENGIIYRPTVRAFAWQMRMAVSREGAP